MCAVKRMAAGPVGKSTMEADSENIYCPSPQDRHASFPEAPGSFSRTAQDVAFMEKAFAQYWAANVSQEVLWHPLSEVILLSPVFFDTFLSLPTRVSRHLFIKSCWMWGGACCFVFLISLLFLPSCHPPSLPPASPALIPSSLPT